ncbi:uncharacterized protein PFLUO_LOCUS5443 [Penicillium psychrofluorescens]|uniref:uncharacterized protein n=1 Tax=Penicillium psychrofluorescens TaxID=3158075 RepID=UPI003CCD5D69
MSYQHRITLLGTGTIGLSMAALHLRRPDTSVTLYDPRPDLESQVHELLPGFLSSSYPKQEQKDGDKGIIQTLLSTSRLRLSASLEDACRGATIIQEQTPETISSKQALWTQVKGFADPTAHLWSSSSGIAASAQCATCPVGGNDVRSRLLVAHPFNPPHLMPLVEIVPGPETKADRVEFVTRYFDTTPGPLPLPASSSSSSSSESQSQSQQTEGYYRPIILHKEISGFVGNRLAFALLREACHLVGEGVVSARDLDAIVTASLGPRWAGSGVFESYHAGGGEGGIGAFLQKLMPTLQPVWRDLGQTEISTEGGEKWREMVVHQTEEAYGLYTAERRKSKEEMLREVVAMQQRRWSD